MKVTRMKSRWLRENIKDTSPRYCRFSSYLIESKELGVIDIDVNDTMLGKTIQDINMPGEFIVVAIKKLSGVTIPEPQTALKAKVSVMGLGKALMGAYVFPFEVISIVLIAALIGTVVIAKKDPSEKKS